ncbi:TonB-dependent receptor [Ohtaekwangia koreensis]|uniref:Iron complex outermembrane recepter protein n=1 Tax=Ohtaekwangia koreensis TaxID=688867 RepID=A0A1T5LM04_9BACT|nr:TonB-dependent receptor [Ohtaekwangia koreensis]SKC76599.1 iron complex outermembrane recepter protein [Ohtaekwangia koreensis]
MYKVFFVAAAMLLSAHVYAQEFFIAGSIRDAKNNQLLTGASLQLEGTNRVAVSDAFGRFKFEKVAAGEYTLVAKFIGYSDKSEKVTASSNVEVTIHLDESFVMTDEVVVLSTRADEKTPATFTNLGKEAIQKQNFGQDLPFLLNWTPSAVTTSDAGTGVGYTGIRIRGSDATRINVTVNGIPYNDAESLGTFWVDVPDIAASSQSIQIQRGVGTSTNGGGAFGATINLQTNTRNDDPYATLMSSAGSFGTFRNSLSFGTGLLKDHWVIDGRVSKINSDGFIDRASADLQSYYFSAGFYAGNTMIKAITFGGKERTYQAWYGVPQSRLQNDTEAMLTTASNEGWNEEQTNNLLNSGSRTFNPYTYKNQVDDYKQDHYQLHFSQRISDAFTANASLHYTPGKGYYEEYRYNNKFSDYGIAPVTIGDSVVTSSDLIRRRWLDNDFYGFTYSFNYEKNKLNAVLGGGWNRYDGDHYGQITWAQVSAVPSEYQYYFNNGDKRDFNIFGKATYNFTERFNAYVDLQYRKVTYTATGIENKQNLLNVNESFNFFNPKAGVTFAVSDNQVVYASYSVANREPVRDDFVDALPGKKPKHENLQNVEAGYKLIGKTYMIKANYYLMNYNNQLVLTGQVNDVGASIRTNVDKSYRMGIELEGALKISERFSWNANVTLSKNKIKDFTEVMYDYGTNFDEYNEVKTTYHNTDISFSPNVIAGSGLNYKPVKNFEATLLTKYVGQQYLDNTSDSQRSIDAYVVNDVRLTYTVQPSFMKELALSFLVNNIFEEEYESNGYTWGYAGGGQQYRENYYYPQAGRNFMAMLTLKF